MKLKTFSKIISIAAFFGLVLSTPLPILAGTFVVDSTASTSDAAIDGLCADSEGKCTLPAAFQEANAANNRDNIKFNISLVDSGYRDKDAIKQESSGDLLGQDDFWVITMRGNMVDWLISPMTIDYFSQTLNQFDSAVKKSEIVLNFSGGKK